jgi:hypothetical protein
LFNEVQGGCFCLPLSFSGREGMINDMKSIIRSIVCLSLS